MNKAKILDVLAVIILGGFICYAGPKVITMIIALFIILPDFFRKIISGTIGAVFFIAVLLVFLWSIDRVYTMFERRKRK